MTERRTFARYPCRLIANCAVVYAVENCLFM